MTDMIQSLYRLQKWRKISDDWYDSKPLQTTKMTENIRWLIWFKAFTDYKNDGKYQMTDMIQSLYRLQKWRKISDDWYDSKPLQTTKLQHKCTLKKRCWWKKADGRGWEERAEKEQGRDDSTLSAQRSTWAEDGTWGRLRVCEELSDRRRSPARVPLGSPPPLGTRTLGTVEGVCAELGGSREPNMLFHSSFKLESCFVCLRAARRDKKFNYFKSGS